MARRKRAEEPEMTLAQSLGNLANGVLVGARFRFNGPLRVWFAQHSPHCFRAYILNGESKQILMTTTSEKSEYDALSKLRTKVSPGIVKAGP